MAWTGSDGDFQAFVDRYGLTFPTISDDPGEVFASFEVAAQPAFVVVAPDGTVERRLGAIEGDEIDEMLTAAGG